MKQFLFSVMISLVGLGVNKIDAFGQDFPEEAVVFEKVYLHVDREFYSAGDDIWFKAYLINGFNNRLIQGFKNIYVQLISENGDEIDNRLIISQQGSATGDFTLPRSLNEGNYFIRAYTKYQQNFDEEGFFHKKIYVASPLQRKTESSEKSGQNKIAVDFLPESGKLVLNAENRIAFKAINDEGKGIPVKGEIVDDEGKEITSFETTYKGMGTFYLTPKKGKTYTAKLDNYSDFSRQLEPAQENGISMEYDGGERSLFFLLKRNSDIQQPQDLILRAQHKDIVLFNTQLIMDAAEMETSLMKQLFPVGISKISLLDVQENILAERLIFVQDNKDKTIQINSDQEKYGTRDLVQLDISSLFSRNDAVDSSLSVAVVNEDYFGASGINQTIESYLLLDSEIKGYVESPASLFADESTISSRQKLDLVMMINGWRSYYWDNLEKYQGRELPNWEDLGIALEGSVTSIIGNNPLEESEVVFSPFIGGVQIRKTTTNQQGQFSFEGLILRDSAQVIIDAKNKRGNRRVDVKIDQPEIFNDEINSGFFDAYSADEVSNNFYKMEMKRLQAKSDYKMKEENILMEEVRVFGKRNLNDGHFRIYGEPDVSLEIGEDDLHYLTILDYLENKVAGVLVGNEGVRIRGAIGNPHLLIDGVPVTRITNGQEIGWEKIQEIPLSDVDKIEILKTAIGMAAFGSSGGNGVISIFTKMRNQDAAPVNVAPGRITPFVKGYNQSRKFYSPVYNLETVDTERPDFRPTLYWNPNVILKNGKAGLQFFTSDNPGRYQIVVEGLSKKGKVCFGTKFLEVISE